MGWGFLEDIGDAVSNAAESVYDEVSDSSFGEAVSWVGNTVDRASFGLASRAMNAADDYVFDSVDYVTGGAINVDFDGGQFSVGAGFDGLASFGTSIGEAGITANGSLPGAAYDVGFTHDGFWASGSAGVDWGPLPYADGHVKISANGDISVGGHVQGTIPTPVGLLSGDVSGGFVSTDQGWGAFVDADGTLRMPNGVTVRGGVDVSYQETEDGSHFSAGAEGSVSIDGIGTAGGAVGYERIEQDGNVIEGFHTEGEVDALGVSVSGEAGYVHTDIDGVETSEWSGDVNFDGPDLASVASTVGGMAAPELGSGDDVLGMAGADLAPMDAPIDDFSQAIQTADDIGDSMDDLFQDLQ